MIGGELTLFTSISDHYGIHEVYVDSFEFAVVKRLGVLINEAAVDVSSVFVFGSLRS